MTYSELVANIAAWLHRDDVGGTLAASFIELAEERFNRTLRLNANSAVVDVTVLTGQSSVNLPADYQEGRGLTAAGGEWTQRTPEALARLKASGSSDKSFAIFGGAINLPFAVGADTVLMLSYWKKIPALTSGAPTNWISLNHPGLYLWGSLAESAVYATDAEQSAVFEARLSRAMAELQQAEQNAAYFAAALQPDYVV